MIRRAIAWTLAGQVLAFVATFGTTVALARILSPLEIGIYAIGAAVGGVLQALAAFGIGTYVVRERELTPLVLSTAFTINALTAVLLASGLIIASFFPVVTLGQPMVVTVLWLLAVVPVIGVFEFRPATMLQRDMAFGTIAAITVVRVVVTAIVSVATALAGASAVSAAYGAVAGAVVSAVAFAVSARHHGGFAMTLAGWRPMILFGFQTLAIGGIAVIAFRLTDFILGAVLGLAALGLYNRAVALSGVPITNVYTSLSKVLFVQLANDMRAGRDLRVNYLRSLDMIQAVLWPMLAGLSLLAWPVVEGLFGPQWMAAAPVLAVLAIGHIIGLSYAMNYELFVLRNEVGRQARIEAVRVFAGLAIFAWACSFGIVGAAIGRLADPVIGLILYFPHLTRLSGSTTRELLTIYARNLTLVVAVLVVPGFVLWGWNGQGPTPFGSLAGAIAASGLCWLGALRLLHHPLWEEIERLVRPKLFPIRS